jgi:hypothetical protein
VVAASSARVAVAAPVRATVPVVLAAAREQQFMR